jgi:poly-gamma-glutamate synthesis protein (capsule biosynthesis protein)
MAGVCCGLLLPAAAEPQRLPVFLADNHAESFGWMARTLDLDAQVLLVLVDAHTDATAAERSEEMREQLRRVPSLAAREARVEGWRAGGRLQAFNWIEPLMPRPLDQVVWVPKPDLTESVAEEMTAVAVAALDGRLEVEPRGAGSFAGRWRTMSARDLEGWEPGGLRQVVLSVDLDFFAGMDAAEQGDAMERIWRRAMDWPGLLGVCFAVSRPWLEDDEEADRLVRLASGLVARTRGAELEIDSSLDDRPDHSARAGELAGEPPRWNAADASPGLNAAWANLGERLRLRDRKRDWETLRSPLRIVADGGEMDCDGVWRFDLTDAPVLRVRGADDATGRVRWFALRSARKAYDFLPATRLGKDFSEAPGRWVYEERHELGESHDFALAPSRWSPGHAGRVRIEAEIETSRGWLPVPAAEIRLLEGGGFLRGLSECFGMPYGFGIAMVTENELEAVETGWAADCSNVMIHAWRRAGVPMRWGDPGILRAQLTTLADGATPDDGVAVSAAMIERGLIVDFGRHVAAVWDDREPRGVLDRGDLVFHHLGGYPEVVTLAELTSARPVFSIRTLAEPVSRIALKFAGDVVLADDERTVTAGFEKGDSDLFLVNLEGVPSMRQPDKPPRHDFRFPHERLGWLRGRGVDAVSLSNNHAGDAGRDGLLEGMTAIQAAGLGWFGAGTNCAEACRPWMTEVRGQRLAVLGVCIVDGMIAGPDLPGIAHLPAHQRQIEESMHEARASGALVVVLMHGGDEYRSEINDAQRHWARWLVRRGARVVAGAHPHVVQKSEIHGGARIFHSLGNAVYPVALGSAGSGTVWEVWIED